MKRVLIFITYIFIALSLSAQTTLTINNGKSYKYETNSSKTGLNMGCYVVQRDISVSINFKSESSETMLLYSFGEFGSSQKNIVTGFQQQGNILTYSGGAKDCGYIIEQGSAIYAFWVSGYVQVTSLSCDYSYSNICDFARVVGDGITIPYYTFYGTMEAIPRKVKFNTWVWNEDDETLETSVETVVEGDASIDDKLVFESPYEKTYITVVDEIPVSWGETVKEISTTEEYEPKAIFSKAVVTQNEREATNEIDIDVEAGVYGGSAPVDMVFEAFVNEDNYYCWQFFQSAIGPDDPSPVVYATYLDQTLSYTFKDAGTTYVRLHSENGSCSEDITFTIVVSESSLDAPNAFSPGLSPGVNDEWKVAYKSIVEFKCVIFDRWGVKMFEFSDPAMGWDGKYKGKFVPAGVYFYVIAAKGSDGKEYKLKGHINILRGKDTYDE